LSFDDADDHVHLLMNYPPKIGLSKLVNSLKGVSSRHMGFDAHSCCQGHLSFIS